MSRSILVAGIGNLFFGDDGFGVEVALRLLDRPLGPGVRVEDYGIRGVHLAYDLLDGCDLLVLVDALDVGDEPGTLAVLRPEAAPATRPAAPPAIDSHTMDPATVLSVLAGLGGSLDDVLVVGCQPHSIAPGIGLSATVAAAVEPACDLVTELVADACQVVR